MLAQLVEQRTFNPFVVGSTPAHPTKIHSKKTLSVIAKCFFSSVGFRASLKASKTGLCADFVKRVELSTIRSGAVTVVAFPAITGHFHQAGQQNGRRG